MPLDFARGAALFMGSEAELAKALGVEVADVLLMADQWLVSGASSADIAPATPDGKVNLKDFAVLAGNWMEGTD